MEDHLLDNSSITDDQFLTEVMPLYERTAKELSEDELRVMDNIAEKAYQAQDNRDRTRCEGRTLVIPHP